MRQYPCVYLGEHHTCPCAGLTRALFRISCAMEGLGTEDALRRLNGKEASK